ncbi:MAG: radical SAM protein [Acidobacteria bacterium]|nr:radical SAM protein [Acidobacteriota bacterium]
MKPSVFNVRVPMPSGEVFLMNTLTDAQIVASNEVVRLLDSLEARGAGGPADADERGALDTLVEHGFVVANADAERAALESRFVEFREDGSQLRVTVLTTLQCNFACDYCYQGDHAEHGRPAEKMSLDTAGRVAAWIVGRMDEVRPGRLVLTFFGGEPLLNVPALMLIADECARHAASRGVTQLVNVITNGLLLTPGFVDRLLPLGLNGVKVTLDGDRETHDRMRPLRGGQGTFDRIIENVRRVAGKVPVSIGGNFDVATAERYPALLDFLREQDFAGRVSNVAFKPIIKPSNPQAAPPPRFIDGKPLIPLTSVDAGRQPLNGSCMSAAGASTGSVCDSCHFADDQMSFLREETRRRGFRTADGVHMGPCELYRRHSHTIGPDGSLYACPGFTGDNALSVGHISGRRDTVQADAAGRFERLAPWRQCGDCSFIPVCGGGCAVAAHTELGDMDAPSCHKRSFESALVSLAEEAVGDPSGRIQ